MKRTDKRSDEQRTNVSLRHTLFARISLVLFVLLVALGIGQFFRVWNEWEFASSYADELASASLATGLAQQFDEVLRKHGALWELQRIAHFAVTANPAISIYLLDADGSIVADLAESGPVARPRVGLEPIRRFLRGELRDGPLYADDPQNIARTTVFSAAPLAPITSGTSPTEPGVPSFVFVGLSNRELEIRSRVVGQRSTLRTAIIDTSAYILAALVSGIIAYRVLTRRFERLTHVVGRFAAGDFALRAPTGGRDEVDALASTFNTMADAITQNIKELAYRDELRRELIGSVSHDLRQPLGVLRAHLEQIVPLLKDRASPEIQLKLDTMLRTERSLELLLNQLFELAKLDAQEQLPDMIPVPPDDLCEDLATRYTPAATSRDITIRTAMSSDGAAVMADPEMIERVLSNLIENALRYTPPAGVITLRTEAHGATVVVSVSDTGAGIAQADLPRIFERHFQGEAGARNLSNAGLGLAIVRRIVELHGGELHVRSAPGAGATFSFALPIAVAA